MNPFRCLPSKCILGLGPVFFKQSVLLKSSLFEGVLAFLSGEDNMNLVLIFCSIAFSSFTFCLRQDLQPDFFFPFKDDLLKENEGLLIELMENEGTLLKLPDIEGLLLLVSNAGLLAITESLDLLVAIESPVLLGKLLGTAGSPCWFLFGFDEKVTVSSPSVVSSSSLAQIPVLEAEYFCLTVSI